MFSFEQKNTEGDLIEVIKLWESWHQNNLLSFADKSKTGAKVKYILEGFDGTYQEKITQSVVEIWNTLHEMVDI